jgi:hypothetical protein
MREELFVCEGESRIFFTATILAAADSTLTIERAIEMACLIISLWREVGRLRDS